MRRRFTLTLGGAPLVKIFRQQIVCSALVVLAGLGVFVVPAGAQGLHLDAQVPVGDGWHPWYEIKADPETPNGLIICGTKWDAQRDSPFGFVYVSGDGGTTWQTAMEDRNSAWVTEHSCAFGSHHRAYFISVAFNDVEKELNYHQDLGTSRLYVSTDGGQHWRETIKTGLADFSTSAISSASGELYTFYNGSSPGDSGRHFGSNVGLLIFSPDGKNVRGPFFDPAVQALGYYGAYPSNATALKSGAVVALSYSTRQTPSGLEGDLGFIRAKPSPESSLAYTIISHTIIGKDCLNSDQGSLAYDAKRNQLFITYIDGCRDTQIMLTSSGDEGKTWTKAVAVAHPQNSDGRVVYPSLVVSSSDALGLLWEEGQGSGNWLFSHIRDQKLVGPLVELSRGPRNRQLCDDSLWTAIEGTEEPDELHDSNVNTQPKPSITLSVRTGSAAVWRVSGLIAKSNKILAVWPSVTSAGTTLYFGVLAPVDSTQNAHGSIPTTDVGASDVTRQSVILYGGRQHFDSGTATLKVCLALENRGDKPMRAPIKLEVKDIGSPAGTVSILDSTNSLPGVGALWDISHSVTGNEILPKTTSNPFCLSFHLEIPPEGIPSQAGDGLLNLEMRVLASGDAPSQNKKGQKN
jgi:hypothetical protein